MTEKILQMVDAYWKFDDNQQPISNWHDKQDLLEEVRKALHIHDVSNRRELLIAFSDAINICDGDKEKIGRLVDLYLKSN